MSYIYLKWHLQQQQEVRIFTKFFKTYQFYNTILVKKAVKLSVCPVKFPSFEFYFQKINLHNQNVYKNSPYLFCLFVALKRCLTGTFFCFCHVSQRFTLEQKYIRHFLSKSHPKPICSCPIVRGFFFFFDGLWPVPTWWDFFPPE